MSIPVETLGRAIKQLQSRHQRNIDAALLEIGSSLAQWDALRAIHRNPGASSHALAEYTFQTDQSFGGLAKRLVEKGLVRRGADNGRAVQYQLTEAGEDVLRRGTLLTNDLLEASFKPLSDEEKAALLAILTKLLPKA